MTADGPAAGPADRPVIWLRAERAGTGRPAGRSRAGITAIAIALADRDGLDAVSMRRVAAELGTGAASLYRYVDTRDDLLDLMTDATAAEYELPAPSGDWLADLGVLGGQALAIMARHPWLAALVQTRPVLGPRAVDVLEWALEALAGHPAPVAAKLEAFAMLNAVTAMFAAFEQAEGSAAARRQAGYLEHALARRPRLAALLTAGGEPPPAASRYADIIARVLAGLLGPG